MTLSELHEKREAIAGRMLQISADLTEMKRVYIVENKHGDFKVRATLEAEHAALALGRHQTNTEISARKNDAKQRTAALELAIQTRLLHERDLGEVVAEARRLADEACGAPA